MKLFYSPGACSLASHIVAREAGIDIDLDKVDLGTKQTASGQDFLALSPKGYVPVLGLENGEVLTEGTAILQYLADLAPASGLAPANGTLPRYRLQEMLGYINSEIHKNYSPLFNKKSSPEVRQERTDYLHKRYGLLETILGTGPYLFGDQFTAADAYLFTVTNWARLVKVDLAAFPNLQAFQQRVGARPAVQAALKAEGLA